MTTSEKTDIDIRFLLANERTLLAWIRTSLAIEAGGVALMQIHTHHRYIGVIVLLLGAVVALIGYQRYRATNIAIHANKLPRIGIGPAVQVAGVMAIALILAVAQFTIIR